MKKIIFSVALLASYSISALADGPENSIRGLENHNTYACSLTTHDGLMEKLEPEHYKNKVILASSEVDAISQFFNLGTLDLGAKILTDNNMNNIDKNDLKKVINPKAWYASAVYDEQSIKNSNSSSIIFDIFSDNKRVFGKVLSIKCVLVN